jgi:alpha-beta hydrolase superfamily lysophospholipase
MLLRWVKRLLSMLLVVILGVYLGVGLFLWVLQDRMLFPAPGGIGRDSLDMTAFEKGAMPVDLEAADGTKLYGWHLRGRQRAEGSGRLLLYFHGNAERVSDYAPLYQMLVERGWDVLAIAYRGYPGSEARPPSEEGLVLDAQAAWGWATQRYRPERVVVHGRSLGGGVAAHLVAGEANPAGLVLESTFASVRELARRIAPVYPLRWLLRNPFDTRVLAPHFGVPVLIMHSRDDQVIPIEHSARELRGLIAEVEYEETSGLSHQQSLPLSDRRLLRSYLSFLERTAPPPAVSSP